MKKIALALSMFLFPALALGTTTYAATSGGVAATATTGTESAPTVVTEGLSLATPSICGVAVIAETAGTMTAGGTLQAYVWNSASATPSWIRLPDFDLTALALAKQAWGAMQIPVSAGRVVWVPNGIGVAVVVYMNVQPCR